MARIWRIVTAAFLVVHLMVGCCAHHAHACEDAHAADSASHDEGSGDETDHSHHEPTDCRGASCSFVFTSNHAAVQLLVQTYHTVAVLHDDVPASVNSSNSQRFFLIGLLPLPVRLHLANQVLLI